MRKTSLLKSLFLLFALIVGTGSVWADPIEVLSWSRSGTTDSYSTGFTFAPSEKASAKDGYYQDSGTKNSTIVNIALYHSTNKLFASTPTSVTFTANLGGGSTKDPLGYSVYACYVDNEGNDIEDTEVTVTTKITDKNGSNFSVSMSTAKATDAYGVKIYHMKEDSWNVRYFGFSLSYEAAASGSKASTPTFDPASGTVLPKAQNITVASTDATKIIYTTNGDEPTVGGATTMTVNAASGTVMIAGSGTITVKAIGIDDEDELTNVASANYSIKPVNPVILPADRSYTGTTNISFTQEDEIDIYYTTDGTVPTSASTKYNGTPFAITENVTIKAIAIDTYGNESDVVEAKFNNTLLQETEFTIALKNSFFGSTGTSNVTDEELSGIDNNTTVTIKKNSGNKLYVNGEQIRLYDKNTMTVTAPSGYNLTSIEFVEPSSGKAWAGTHTSSPTGYDGDAKKWTGMANEVTITFGGTCRMVGLNITLAPSTLSATVPSAGWATWIPALNVEVPSGVSAYIVSSTTSDKAVLQELLAIPAGEPVVLKGAANTYTFDVCDDATLKLNETDVNENLLAVSDETTTSGVYVLANGNNGAGFYLWKGGLLGAGRVYLPASAVGAREFIGFGDESTGIKDYTRVTTANNRCYNLNGQRVDAHQKGLYIVNGKKVIIK